MITLMVINGFSLLELRKLYIDEFNQYHAELIFLLEKTGKAEVGSYDKIKSSNNDIEDNTANELRSQLSKIMTTIN